MTAAGSSRFRSDAAKLISGTVISQGIAIASVPVLAWFFDPDAFGLAAVFTAVVLIIGVVACLRYELALVLPERDEDACNVLAACLLFPLVVAALLIPIVLWVRQPLAAHWDQPALAELIWLIPIAILFHGWLAALSYWQTRKRRYVNQSVAKTAATFSQASGSIAAGSLGHATGTVLVAFQLIGQLVSIFVLALTTWKNDFQLFRATIHPSVIYQQIIKYRKFPIVDTWAELLNIASSNLPILLLGYYFPITVVGHYSLGHRLLNIPMSLVGRSMSQVFFQNASVAHREGNLCNLVTETASYLFRLSLFPFLVIAIVGSDVFGLVFGTKWETAGLFAQILAPWLLFQFLYVPMSNLLNVLQLQEMGLALSLLLFVSRVGALIYGGMLGDPLVSMVLFSLFGCMIYAAFFGYLLRKSGVAILLTAWNLLSSQKMNLCLIVVLATAKLSGSLGTLPMVGLATVASIAYLLQVFAVGKFFAKARTLLGG
ncbi:MAG: oligosaccharide flippase family protein [Pirellulaceae bacterium]|nr:oligosaccharide flippase family protein [Pirellulaceae bacterium]